MAGINIKKYAAASEQLERLADGAKAHESEPGFPALVAETVIRELRKNLEDKRQAYENFQYQAKVAYEDYSVCLKDCEDQIAKISSLLYGMYGKRAVQLSDFGLVPWKTGGKRRPVVPPPIE